MGIQLLGAVIAILVVLASCGAVAACAAVVVNRQPGVTLRDDPWHACFLLSPQKLTTRGLIARRVAFWFIAATCVLGIVLAILMAAHHD